MPMMCHNRWMELANEATPPGHRSSDPASKALRLGFAGAHLRDVVSDMPRPDRSPETVSVHRRRSPLPMSSGLSTHHSSHRP